MLVQTQPHVPDAHRQFAYLSQSNNEFCECTTGRAVEFKPFPVQRHMQVQKSLVMKLFNTACHPNLLKKPKSKMSYLKSIVECEIQ